jgi:hypothetical protein
MTAFATRSGGCGHAMAYWLWKETIGGGGGWWRPAPAKIGDEMGGPEYLAIKGEEGPRESSCEPWKRMGRGAGRRGEGRDVARWAPTATAGRLSATRIIMAILVLPKGTERERVLPGSPT